MFNNRRNFFNCRRLFFYLTLVSLFICISIYNYYYVERYRGYEYESIIEEKLLVTNIIDESTSPRSVEERFKARRKLMIQKCEEYQLNGNNVTKRQPNAWEFLINDEYKLVWCNVFKAASSSWFYNFNLLAGYSKSFLDKTKITSVSLARKKYPRPSAEELDAALKDHLSFIIVRHPYERLISAYRDKFEYPYNEYFRPLGNKIIKTIREEGINGKFEAYPPTFEEFINYIICQWELGKELNEHWIPIYKLCTPCQVNFDLILKVETLKEDQGFLINQTNLQNILKPTWKNSARNEKTSDLKEKYFSQLNYDGFSELSHMFKFDLELFGYSTEEYKDYPERIEFPLFVNKCYNMTELDK